MRKSNYIFLVALAAMVVACGNSNENGGGSGEEDEVAEGIALLDGDYAGIGTFLTNLRIVNLGSNTPPAEGDCIGDIEIEVDSEGADVIVGEGDCMLPANAVSYTLVGNFIGQSEFEGVITLVLNGRDNVVNFAGSIEEGVLSASFTGRTPVVGNLVADWDGEFEATRFE